MIRSPGITLVPGAFNAFLAKLVENYGFPAVYVSGSGTSMTLLGRPDVGLVTLNEMVMNVRYICQTVEIPVISDADTGYGNAVNVTRTVRDFIEAGAAAIHIEDQEMPKKCGHYSGKTLVSRDEMVGKLRAAVDTRDKYDPDFVVIARTDARGASGGGFDEAVARANLYAEAGADMIFADGLASEDEVASLPKRVKSPVMANMVEGGLTPLHSADELAAMGYRLVIFPNSLVRLMQRAASELLDGLKRTGSTAAFLERMTLFPGPHELVGLSEFKRLEKKYVPEEVVTAKYAGSLGA
jgi:2-methylisocitrate lyase-like PEP mutase family enzyme